MDLKQLIDNYQTSQRAKDIIRKAKIVFLVGISGAGKDTLGQELLKDDRFEAIISHTTRQPRINNGIPEVNDISYHFVSEDEAMKMAKAEAFVEIKFVHGIAYGTSISEIEKAYDNNKIAITDIDIQGVSEYMKISSKITNIFIVPPDYKTWKERLEKRYPNHEEFLTIWQKRRQSAINELREALTKDYYTFIINDKLSDTIKEAQEIIFCPDDKSDIHYNDKVARIAAKKLLR